MTADEVVKQLLASRGVPDEEIEQAEARGQLQVLSMTAAAIAEPRTLTQADVAGRAGMSIELTQRLWRALGFPDVQPDERAFTESDAEALTVVRGLMDLGLTDEEVAVQMTRIIGSSMARIAEAQVEVASRRQLRDEQAELFVTAAGSYMTTQAWLLEYVWRRHLEAAGRRSVLGGAADSAGRSLVVGFADLVGFTALSQQLDEEELALVVDRFEEVAHDTVTVLGGRITKMIGDEAMFVVDSPQAGLEIGLRLAELYADDDLLSDVRVGVASGPVLAHDGDYYGPVVNLASRIVSIAYPGTVVASDDLRQALADDERYSWQRMRPRELKDIGRVQLWHVARAGADTDETREVMRRRRTRALRLIPDLSRIAAIGREFVDDRTP